MVDLDPRPGHHRGRPDASGPDDCPGGDHLALSDDHLRLANLANRRAETHLESTALETLAGERAHLRRQLRQDLVLELDQVGVNLRLADLGVVATPHAAHEVLQLARGLDARQPGSPDHEGQVRLPVARIVLQLGALQHLDHPVAQAKSVGQRLHAHCVLLETGNAEGVRDPAQRQHQGVVVQAMRVAVAAHDGHHMGLGVDRVDLGGDAPGRLVMKHAAQRRDDVPGLEDAGADLRQERGEEHEVVAADEPDLDVASLPQLSLEGLRGHHPGESTTQDEDPMRPRSACGHCDAMVHHPLRSGRAFAAQVLRDSPP